MSFKLRSSKDTCPGQAYRRFESSITSAVSIFGCRFILSLSAMRKVRIHTDTRPRWGTATRCLVTNVDFQLVPGFTLLHMTVNRTAHQTSKRRFLAVGERAQRIQNTSLENYQYITTSFMSFLQCYRRRYPPTRTDQRKAAHVPNRLSMYPPADPPHTFSPSRG